MRHTNRILAAAAAAIALVGTALPATAITGGEPDKDGDHPAVALLVFYAKDHESDEFGYRYRCTGTLISEQVILTAAHCAELTLGKTLVTFAPEIAYENPVGHPELSPLPRAADDSSDGEDEDGALIPTGPDGWGSSADGFQEADTEQTLEYYSSEFNQDPQGHPLDEPTYYSGTAYVHPEYSGFTDLRNWNDVGVIQLDEEVTGFEPAQVAADGYLDQFRPKVLNKTIFTSVGYGTEVRKPEAGPQAPTPMSYPLIRRVATSNGQKLTPQILQTNGNPNNKLGTGGTCFGDSGGPTFHEGNLVTVTSYGYTSNCRYLDGLQRVDIPVVQEWLAGFAED